MKRILKLVESEFTAQKFEVFVRNAIKGEPSESLAKEFGITLGQVYKIKFRVIERLREEADELINIPGFFEQRKSQK